MIANIFPGSGCVFRADIVRPDLVRKRPAPVLLALRCCPPLRPGSLSGPG